MIQKIALHQLFHLFPGRPASFQKRRSPLIPYKSFGEILKSSFLTCPWLMTLTFVVQETEDCLPQAGARSGRKKRGKRLALPPVTISTKGAVFRICI
jgi:hypothetical protein